MLARDSAHDFIVKFIPSVCVALVASLTREMTAQSFVYHAHGRADSDKSQGLCAMHDKTLNQQCMLVPCFYTQID